MPQLSETPGERTKCPNVLSLSPFAEDHRSLQTIIGHSDWEMQQADCVPAALSFLGRADTSVLICESDVLAGNWSDVLDQIHSVPHPPAVIVTSKFADDRLWAEALNLGAWDVLAKPFDRNEVLRSIKIAWQHWQDSPAHPVWRTA